MYFIAIILSGWGKLTWEKLIAISFLRAIIDNLGVQQRVFVCYVNAVLMRSACFYLRSACFYLMH